MNSKIDLYRNNISFCLSVLTAISLYQGYYHNNFHIADITTNILFVYCLCDIFLVKNVDYIIHHIFALLIIIVSRKNDVSFEEYQHIMYIILGTEITNFFFVFTFWFKNKNFIIYYLSGISFAISFFIIRIYIYFKYLIFNFETYKIINNYIDNVSDLICIYVGLFGLAFLNIYWAIKILRIIFFRKKIGNKNN